MFKAEKVLWGEGLFLRPQHFQLQDRYHEQRLNYTIRSTVPFAYGIQNLSFDQVSLSQHVLALTKLEILWQDGELYQAPHQDLLPEPIQLDEFNTHHELLIYIALPILQANKPNLSFENQTQQGRYYSYLEETHDLFTDASPAEITLLRRRVEFKLLQGIPDQIIHGFYYLAIGKIKRQNPDRFELDANFIPPILHIHACPSLNTHLTRTLNIIQAKINALKSNQRENDRQMIEFRAGDIASFWLMNILNTAYAKLKHISLNPHMHPERLFLKLLNFTASLLTFSNQYTVDQLPQYQHHKLQHCFEELDSILRHLLEIIISKRCIHIPLKETHPSYWCASLQSEITTRCFQLYLAISSDVLPIQDLIKNVPLRFKVGNSLDVEQRVVSALAAIPLHHLIQAPSAIPVRTGMCYFQIETQHELYQHVIDSESICIYIPTGFEDIHIELIAVLNEK